jgi:hypothetical protein
MAVKEPVEGGKRCVEAFNYGIYDGGAIWSDREHRGARGVRIGAVTFWFSYYTVIAFKEAGHSVVVSENEWGSTTEQLLYWVDGGDWESRLAPEEFEKRLEELLAKYSLVGETVKRPT